MLIAIVAHSEQGRCYVGEEARAVREAIQLDSGHGIKQVLEHGTNAVPYVLPYLSATNALRRENAIIILGHLRDPRAVKPLMNSLNDQDPNVRRRAITSLYKIAEHAPSYIDDDQLTSLTQYGRGSDENAHLAILIIGESIGASGLPVIKQLCDQATDQIASGGGMAVIGKRKQEACLRVLADLGDKGARDQVRQLLSSPSPEDRAKGIDVVAYVGGNMSDELVPLLSDKRNAVDISPSQAGDYFLRVCDLAADVLRDNYHVELESRKRARYSDHDLDVLKRTFVIDGPSE